MAHDVYELKLPRDANGTLALDKASAKIAANTTEIVWSFNQNAEVDIYSPFMSGARRMPNGNTVMMQACDKPIVEIDIEGTVVLDFHVGGPGRMFRVGKYPRDYAGV